MKLPPEATAYIFILFFVLPLFMWVCSELGKRYAAFVPLARKIARSMIAHKRPGNARSLIMDFASLAWLTPEQRDQLLAEFELPRA